MSVRWLVLTFQREPDSVLGVQEYLESVMERERWSEQMKVKDPRSEEENLQASSLLNLVLVRTHINIFYPVWVINI